jgi:hypothetical protein
MISIKEEFIEYMGQHKIENTLSKMLGFKAKEQWRYLAWGVTQDQRDRLIQDIEEDKKDPPLYGVSGDLAKFNSDSRRKHNCFTWAREKLVNLQEDEISNKLEPMFTDWVAAKTSFYLPDYPPPFWKRKNVIIPSVTFIAGGILGRSLKSKL